VGSSFQLQQGNSYLKAKSPPFEQHLPSGGAQEVQHLDEPMDLMNQQVYDESKWLWNFLRVCSIHLNKGFLVNFVSSGSN
jgi:hypothetical protein